MLNITLFSLTISRIYNSPFISLSSANSYQSIAINQLQASKFGHHCLYTHSKLIPSSIAHSSFHGFLKAPLVFDKEDKSFNLGNYTSQQIISTENYHEGDEITIMDCDFQLCTDEGTSGGAISMRLNGTLILHRSNFHECSANNGGAVYVASELGSTFGDILFHLKNANQFYSHFCCYSNCAATDYGSAALIAATTIQLNYSATFDCPNNQQATGAQLDLQSNDYIGSNYINATTGNSKYCAGMEYRYAKGGGFRYQTIVNQKGAFITSFTDLTIDQILIAQCNFVNSTIYDSNTDPKSAVLHVRIKPIVISAFCFINIMVNTDKFNLVSKGLDKDEQVTITLRDCYVDDTIDDKYFSDISTINVVKLPNAKITTHVIYQLKLGQCEGEISPPAIDGTVEMPTPKPIISDQTTEPTTITIETTAPTAIPNEEPPQDQGEGNQSSGLGGAAIGGIVAGCVAAVVAVAIAAFFIKNRLKPNVEVFQEAETQGSSVNTQNPLYKEDGADDPFQEDFADGAL